MATNQTIVTTLMADPRPFTRGIGTAINSTDDFGKAFGRLDAATRRANIGGGLTPDLQRMGGASGNAARGVLELSRGVEDAAVSFGLNGFQGAVRGSLNNISQFAMIMGGPVAGAVAGFAAAGVSIAAPYIASLFDATEQAKRFSEQLDIVRQKSKDLFESRVKEAEGAIDFRNELGGLESSDAAQSGIAKREQELLKMEARIRELQVLRDGLMTSDKMGVTKSGVGGLSVFGLAGAAAELGKGGDPFEAQFGVEKAEAMRAEIAKADQLDFQLMNERMELVRKETEMRVEIGRLKAKELELTKQEAEAQRQKDAEEFAAIIRKFQEEDAKAEEQAQKERERDEERKREKLERDLIRDNERIQGILKGRISGLGGKNDPLDGMNAPEGMRPQLEGLFSRLDEMDQRRGPQFANVATAGSQSMLRAQFQAKEAAKAEAQRKTLIDEIRKIVAELKEANMHLRPDEDDVNLN